MTLAAWQLADLLNPLVLFGFAGQFVFMLRFLVQWYASESRGRSVVPVAFWYISVLGGLILLAYAILREDIVFSAGQALGLLIYVRNIWLIHSRRRRHAARRRAAPAGPHSERASTGEVRRAAAPQSGAEA